VVYRPRLVFIICSLVLAVASGGLSLVAIAASAVSLFRGSPDKAAEWIIVGLMSGGFAALMWRQSQLRVIADDMGLMVVNYFSTHRLAWSEVERFDSSYGYFGIVVVTKDGRVIRLNALQKSNLARWLNMRVRADRIANQLNAQLSHEAAEDMRARMLRGGAE
jgi:Bacterial PH domain